MLALLQQTESTAEQWWSKLLGIDRIDLSSGTPDLEWHYMPDLWVMLLVIVPAVAGMIWLIYRNERHDVGLGPKIFLTAVRAMIILLVILLLMGPVLTVETKKYRRSYLIVMVDESLSMLKKDPPLDPKDKAAMALAAGLIRDPSGMTPSVEDELKQMSRAELVRRLLSHPEYRIFDQLEEKLNVAYFVFSKGARQVADRAELVTVEPSGTETAIGDSVRQALGRLRGQRVVGIVVISDGQNNAGTDPNAVAGETRKRFVPIYTIPAGVKTVVRDIQLLELEARDAVLANDRIELKFKVRSIGFQGEQIDVPLFVYPLKDRPLREAPTRAEDIERLLADGAVRELVRPITLGADNRRQEVMIQYEPREPGEYLLILKAHPQEGENNLNNNYLLHRLRVADDKLRVLYVEHPPRYEYRYLKNALIRDEKMLVHCLLTSADIGFPQEHSLNPGDPAFREPIKEFPQTLRELLKYDVLILGDVDIGKIGGSRAAEMIEKFVGEFGGGLVLISGEANNPFTFRGSPMIRLLPVVAEEPRAVYDPDLVYESEFGYSVTAVGRTHEIILNCWPQLAGDADRITEQWEDRDRRYDGLRGIRWFSPVRAVKPGAIPLVEVSGVPGTEKKPPLFVAQHYGRGRVFWSATDETWLWRFKTGDSPWFYPFWRQAMYWTRQGKLLGAVRYRIEVDKDTYQQNETVTIYASAYDRDFRPLNERTLTVHVEPPEGKRIPVVLEKDKTRDGYYEGTFQPTILGRYKIWAGEDDEATRAYDKFTVFVPNREEADPSLNVAKLQEIADASTDGVLQEGEHPQFYPLTRVQELPNDIKKSKQQLTEKKEDDLWDSPLVYLLFALLITTEWIVRKIFRML